MMGTLTTQVLDTASGRPAADLAIELWAMREEGEKLLKTVRTNAEGRTDAPLLDAASMAAGTYELLFFVGDYFAAAGAALTDPRFLDVVPVRFGIADAAASYHVPLLVSPWSYSTCRGS
jgi:5-hydroxyisourate hydrolase